MPAWLNRFLDHYRGPRILGLDLLRIWASITIVAFHGSAQAQLFARGPLRHGYLAVDVFFVLSGWLLTRQALRMREPGLRLFRYATRFWTRRWFRILPAYWVALSVVIAIGTVVPLRFGLLPRDFLRHALFLQTLFKPNLYSISWSLVAEEWFYLLLPASIVAFALVRRRAVVVACLVAVLLVPLIVRALTLGPIGSDTVLTWPQARFDGLVVGSALGAAWTLAPQWRASLLSYRAWLFGAGLGGFLVLLFVVRDGFLFWTVGLLAVSLTVGMMVPLLTELRWPALIPPALPLVVTLLSDLTYPLYLFHMLGYRLVDQLAIHSTVRYFAVAVPVIVLGALLLHVGVERPFLALRHRLEANRARGVVVLAPEPA